MVHSTIQNVKSRLLKATNHATHKISPVIREAFAQVDWSTGKLPETHSHAQAALERNSVAYFAERVAQRTGMQPYFLQMANADQKSGHEGARAVFWGKDLTTDPRVTPVKPHHLLVAVDDDYHMDIKQLLLSYTNPVLLYTIAPTVPAGPVKDGFFRFDGGEFEMRVKGGAVFRHKLWDYGPDCVTVSGWVWRWGAGTRLLPRPRYRTVTYLVERRNVSPHRQLVLLVPIGKHMYLAGLVAKSLHSSPLTRMDPRTRGFNLIRSVGDKHEVSISRDGEYTSVTVSADTYSGLMEIAVRQANAKNKLTIASVESHLPATPDRKCKAAILCAYLVEATTADFARGALYVHPVELGVASYQFNPKTYDQEAKPGLTSFMAPLVGGAPAPDSTRANDERTIKARITDVKPSYIAPDAFHTRVVREFVERLIPTPGLCIPGTYEENFDRQPRPTQRAILEEADLEGDHSDKHFKSFQKKEAYGKIGDPRNITTIPGKDKADYSTFMYAFSDTVLKGLDWYAFGKTPIEVATHVAAVCESSEEGVMLGDLHRQDGRTGNLCRELEDTVMMRAFAPMYHDNLLKVMRTQRNRPGRTTHGVRYNSGDSRASGSPETSAFNTLENAFIAFKAHRMTAADGNFIQADEAWSRLCALGMFGGDDSIQGDLSIEAYTRAAKSIGHVAKGEFKSRGHRGVNFLSRVYAPDVWCGQTDSMCDFKRALWKFHTCAHLPDTIKPEQKLVEKAISMSASDAETPIFCDLFDSVNRLRGRVKPSEGDTSWWYTESEDCRYPNTFGDWMDDEVALAIPDLDREGLQSYLQSATTLNSLLSIPIFIGSLLEPKLPDVDVVLNGDVRLAGCEEEKADGPPVPTSPLSGKKPRRARSRTRGAPPAGAARQVVEEKADDPPVLSPAVKANSDSGNRPKQTTPQTVRTRKRGAPNKGAARKQSTQIGRAHV